ncbi:MAG: hypothetical protein Q8927_01620 [Bacteroidota bacterium]|nr:hypothetical protein [Bacteroidota bacterium]MDP4214869.1 hypothetical protein [Bacteroidota bacterium]MDP4244731.1 hypothetical protein [Bacteroidota bacterium]MDP4255491.1 hypothetical protein [Bacteroidota bacterium]
MKNVLCIGALLLLAASCRNKNPSAADAGAPSVGTASPDVTDSVQKSYFPVADYLRNEIRTVDSTPIAILKYTTRNNRTDSAFISAPVFDLLAQEFLAPELDSPAFEKRFSETSFADRTTNSVTFTYSSLKNEQPVQRVDILLDPEANNRLKSIYMEKSFSAGDTLVTKKMLWKAGRNFLIITTQQLPGQAALVRQLKVVWDSDPSGVSQ